MTDAELVRAIVENPDEDSAYLVYADWLMAQSDPRGELIVLQHDADEADRARKATLKRAAKALLDRHAARFLGPLADFKHGTFDITWRYGFARKLVLQWTHHRRRMETDGALEQLAAVLEHPSFAFIIELQLGAVFDDDRELDLQGVIDTLVELRRPACVRMLELGITNAERVTTDSWEFGPLIAALPQLRRIRLREQLWDEPRADDPMHEMMIERRRKKPRPPAREEGSTSSDSG